MSQTSLTPDSLLAVQEGRLQRLLDKVPGMESITSYRYRWLVGKDFADIRFDPGEAIRISFDAEGLPSGSEAVALHGQLPGNLRFAIRRSRSLLVADTLCDGMTHLPKTFDKLKTGLSVATSAGGDEERNSGETDPITTEEVRSAIQACDWAEDTVVELEEQWELRPRLHGDAKPVLARIEGEELRLARPLSAGVSEVVADQALRFNDQIRHARLAVRDDKFVAEARLHRGQLTRNWLESAAQAVAVASTRTDEILSILADSGEVADLYAGMFLPWEE